MTTHFDDETSARASAQLLKYGNALQEAGVCRCCISDAFVHAANVTIAYAHPPGEELEAAIAFLVERLPAEIRRLSTEREAARLDAAEQKGTKH